MHALLLYRKERTQKWAKEETQCLRCNVESVKFVQTVGV